MPMPDNSPLSLSFNVKFAEAISAAKRRKVVLPDVYYGELQGIARQLAFSISGVTSYDQLKGVMDSLSARLESGQSFNDWKKEAAVADLGLPKHRLDNIFRTNLQGNYMAGKWEKFERNKKSRPYLMYDSVNDSRVRPSHLALDGIIRHIDDKFWDTNSAPRGFRCRCSMISLSADQAMARSNGDNGLNKDVGADIKPDPGWDYSPRDRMAGINSAVVDKKTGSTDGILSGALYSALESLVVDTIKAENQ
jgi:SPP1 gp7 family putative phage head morphogenesis protein